MKITNPPEQMTLHLDDIERMPKAFVGSDIVLLTFIRHCTEQYGYCCFLKEKLPLQLNMSIPTYRRSRDKLLKHGFIARYYSVTTKNTTTTNGNVAYIYIPTTMTHPDKFLVGDIV